MPVKKYIKVNATFLFCFYGDEELEKDHINIEYIQEHTNRSAGIEFFPDEGDICIINSVELDE